LGLGLVFRDQEEISLPLQGLDTNTGIVFEIFPDLSDIDIQITGIEKGIISPYLQEELFAFDYPVYGNCQLGKDLTFAM
jgi:hypothetical protein